MKAKATWLPSGEKAASLSKPVRPAKGTISMVAALLNVYENRQIPTPPSTANNRGPNRYPPRSTEISHTSFEAADTSEMACRLSDNRSHGEEGLQNLGLSAVVSQRNSDLGICFSAWSKST